MDVISKFIKDIFEFIAALDKRYILIKDNWQGSNKYKDSYDNIDNIIKDII